MSDLTQARLKELLSYDPDTGNFIWIKKTSVYSSILIGSVAGSVNDRGYKYIKIDGKDYRAHRLAWLYVYGEFPDDIIDHMNRDRADNRISNLRIVTQSVNSKNGKIRKNNTSGITGVYWYKPTQKWLALASINKKLTRLGLFDTIEEAIAARKAAEKKFYSLPE